MYYPPVDVTTKKPRVYWLCPECYQWRIKKLDKWLREGYYFFHQIGTTATLEQLGFKSFDEYQKRIDRSNKYFK